MNFHPRRSVFHDAAAQAACHRGKVPKKRESGLTAVVGSSTPSLRQLKGVMTVARTGSVTAAAIVLGRSQTAVTKAVAEVERQLGVSLFDRSASGVTPTVYGTLLARRAQYALDEFARAGLAFQEKERPRRPLSSIPIFGMDISNRRLAAFLALVSHGNVRSAATALGVTPNAIHKSINELEAQLGCALFVRLAGAHVAPTPYCTILAQYVRSAFSEIHVALSELKSVSGVLCGDVAIGTLPFLRPAVLPRAIESFLREHPAVNVSSTEGDLDELILKLRSGEVDCIAGVSRPVVGASDLIAEQLFIDELVIVAREGHPLTKAKAISLAELAEHAWVLKPPTSPSTTFFRNVLADNGMELPRRVVETASISLTRGLLLESDRLSFASRAQTASWRPGDKLARLDVDLSKLSSRRSPALSVRLLRRGNSTPSPACRAFIDVLERVVSTVT